MDARRVKGKASALDGAYNDFWDECHSIDSDGSTHHHHETDFKMKDTDTLDQETDDFEWLNDIGFACVVMKYKADKEVDPEDSEIQTMTSTLTRRQSETVRKRIRSLNETLKRKRKESASTSRHPDVRDIFPMASQSEDSHTANENKDEDQPDKHHKSKNGICSVGESLESIFITNDNQRGGEPKTCLSTSPNHDGSLSPVFANPRTSPRLSDDRGPDHTNPLQFENSLDSARFARPIDLNMNMFYQPEDKPNLPRSPQVTQSIRPPPPRRARSDGVFRVLGTGLPNVEKTAKKLDKTQSDTSPVHSKGSNKNDSLHVRSQDERKRTSKWYQETFADSEMINRIYGLSPKRQGSTKHRSAEDLSKITSTNDNNNIKVTEPSKTMHRGKSCDGAIDVDAKLNIGTESAGKDNSLSSSFRGEAFSPLPNFTLQPEILGLTRISDLSEPDMIKVRSLALIELTALFDTFGISINRRRNFTKLKYKEHGIFGVPLHILAQKDKGCNDDELGVPKCFKDVISFLEVHGLREEGLLRVPGSQQRIKALREEIEEKYGNSGFFSWHDRRVNDVSTILKQLLRELPLPLLTHEYQNTFIAVSELKDRKLQLQALNLLVLLLPPVNRETLQLLLKFLSKIVAAENINKMGLNNVAMIMAPNLFFLRTNDRANVDEIRKAAATTDIMRMLLKYQTILWTVPGFMVTQIRYLYEAGSKKSDAKAVKKIIAKRMKSGLSPTNSQQKFSLLGTEETDFAESDYVPIIRVKAPMCNKTCMAIQVSDNMTAADVISRFRSKRKNSVKDYKEMNRLTIDQSTTRCRSDSDLDRDEDDAFSLYESGGNIGERCLDPNTNITALIKANPTAEWILKAKALP